MNGLNRKQKKKMGRLGDGQIESLLNSNKVGEAISYAKKQSTSIDGMENGIKDFDEESFKRTLKNDDIRNEIKELAHNPDTIKNFMGGGNGTVRKCRYIIDKKKNKQCGTKFIERKDSCLKCISWCDECKIHCLECNSKNNNKPTSGIDISI